MERRNIAKDSHACSSFKYGAVIQETMNEKQKCWHGYFLVVCSECLRILYSFHNKLHSSVLTCVIITNNWTTSPTSKVLSLMRWTSNETPIQSLPTCTIISWCTKSCKFGAFDSPSATWLRTVRVPSEGASTSSHRLRLSPDRRWKCTSHSGCALGLTDREIMCPTKWNKFRECDLICVLLRPKNAFHWMILFPHRSEQVNRLTDVNYLPTTKTDFLEASSISWKEIRITASVHNLIIASVCALNARLRTLYCSWLSCVVCVFFSGTSESSHRRRRSPDDGNGLSGGILRSTKGEIRRLYELGRGTVYVVRSIFRFCFTKYLKRKRSARVIVWTWSYVIFSRLSRCSKRSFFT